MSPKRYRKVTEASSLFVIKNIPFLAKKMKNICTFEKNVVTLCPNLVLYYEKVHFFINGCLPFG